MRHLLRQISAPRDERFAMASDAVGVVALFVLFYAALHLPLLG
ncbi:hypothetical protein [Rhodobacter sp. NTK016B]|nr:hypothetical protein [Rhodobacter sp. NTK016B]